MRGLALAALMVISACGAPGSATGTTPASIPRGVVNNASHGRTTVPPSPQTAIAFSCRLPVLWFNQDPRLDGKTGFVTFPSDSLASSPTTLPTPPPFTLGYTYDLAVGGWLPVAREAVAPDGLHYAYADYDPPGPNDVPGPSGKPVIGKTGRVHVVDARSGFDRVVYSGAPTFAVVDFSTDGLYLAQFSATLGGSGRRGLYLMNPAGGAPSLLPDSNVQLDGGGWRVLNEGSAWGTRSTQPQGTFAPSNELVQFYLKSHSIMSWFTVPSDQSLFILGFDTAGRPLVSSLLSQITTGQSWHPSIYLLTAPGRSTQLYTADATGPGWWPDRLGISDSHGLWMGGGGSIWLYQPANGVRSIPLLDNPNAPVQVGCACV